MFVELDLQSEVPIYKQLADQLIEGIASGKLAAGQPLPSVRALAADLGINLHTVNKAYQTLKQEGFLEIHRKKGVIVQPGPLPAADEAFLARLRRDLRPLAAEASARGLNEQELTELMQTLYRSIQNPPPEGGSSL
ncbi:MULTISPECIES: GntR family transcriptional regulator [Saccharibacillus]|uniref:GntR family transcriptional regulator n=1 Tax=Saccharibacillus brassicae TaxID=2583377 RepID=A0A4Y6UPL7_SACBS|nr:MULTISPECIES: GntR family transcriptional regulator [Saccharibacillus]MWJ33448.1 GntR family transcriptional regulator [Saccharibacillus sp. WB 17]QDH19573.1 GntR family transcriptional regulator [Saccharibacillus brassicae]